MNNYIVDPSVFYWINVLDVVHYACNILSVISILALIGLILFAISFYCENVVEEPTLPDEKASDWEKERHKELKKEYDEIIGSKHLLKKWLIVVGIILVIAVAGNIFIPDKKTSIEILVAKTATFDNVNWTVQQVKEIIDYITSSMKGIV